MLETHYADVEPRIRYRWDIGSWHTFLRSGVGILFAVHEIRSIENNTQ